MGPGSIAPRRLRVVHVSSELTMGGLEKLLVDFARHTDRSRYDLRFVSLGPRGVVADEIEAVGWPVHALHIRPGLRPGMVLRLTACLRRWKADVIHTHNFGPLIYAGPAARLAGVPGIVHTRHGRDDRAGPRRRLAFRLGCLLADQVVCVSDDSARLTASQGIARGRLCRVWNGVDLTRFAYLGPQERGPVVMVARMSPEKDTETLVRAAAIAARQDPSFRLEVAGDGACLPALRRLAAELGVEGQVRFLGQVRDIPALLARASVFVLSSHSEGVSLTLLEAMARGLPAVATRVGGNPEVVVDGQTGFLVPPRSPEALAARLLLLLGRPGLAREMGLAGRRRVEEHFNLGRVIEEYGRLYHKVAHRARPGPAVLRGGAAAG